LTVNAGNKTVDPVGLSQALIRCASVTPTEGGALNLLQSVLQDLGFTCHRQIFEDVDTPPVDNLYAHIGGEGPNFCFAGHTDVVPVGDEAAWTLEPFAAEIRDGVLYGRGVSDMKGAIAAFVAATDRYLSQAGGRPKGSISLLITADEEGPAINGTVKMLKWLEERGDRIDHCVVGEPTNPTKLGETIKIGRRGSMSGHIVVRGKQGHVAYPQLADNPVPKLVELLARLSARQFDTGNAHFQPTNLEITTVDVGNEAGNVIPASAEARFNIRFNTEQTSAAMAGWLEQQVDATDGASLSLSVSAEPFLTDPGPFTDLLTRAVADATGRAPELNTAGGTSDARFITNYCPVAEFGLTNETAHKVDECALVDDIVALSEIYRRILEYYFD
jgi:succinyl-diaminopimelate desuccinylase